MYFHQQEQDSLGSYLGTSPEHKMSHLLCISLDLFTWISIQPSAATCGLKEQENEQEQEQEDEQGHDKVNPREGG